MTEACDPTRSVEENEMLFELAMLSVPQCKALQVGALIQLPEVPEAEREQVAKAVLLKT
jgi:hypothetical protein